MLNNRLERMKKELVEKKTELKKLCDWNTKSKQNRKDRKKIKRHRRQNERTKIILDKEPEKNVKKRLKNLFEGIMIKNAQMVKATERIHMQAP